MKSKSGFLASLLLSVICAPAFAGLGGDASSVDVDRASVKGATRITSSAAGFAVHEISNPAGMQIREYVGTDGKVFAVSWQGPAAPDLAQVLGSYYAQVVQAARGPHYNHHHLTINTPAVVLQSSGHLRTFIGRAWAPALLPQNISVADIK